MIKRKCSREGFNFNRLNYKINEIGIVLKNCHLFDNYNIIYSGPD